MLRAAVILAVGLALTVGSRVFVKADAAPAGPPPVYVDIDTANMMKGTGMLVDVPIVVQNVPASGILVEARIRHWGPNTGRVDYFDYTLVAVPPPAVAGQPVTVVVTFPFTPTYFAAGDWDVRVNEVGAVLESYYLFNLR